MPKSDLPDFHGEGVVVLPVISIVLLRPRRLVAYMANLNMKPEGKSLMAKAASCSLLRLRSRRVGFSEYTSSQCTVARPPEEPGTHSSRSELLVRFTIVQLCGLSGGSVPRKIK